MSETDFETIFQIMKESFPEYERRTYEGQKALLGDAHYRIISKVNDTNQLVAFMAVWEFPLFRFVEHIAVTPAGRGSGIGGKLMADYIAGSQKPIILEVELPDTDLAQRRIGFYERLGLHLNDFGYVQPSLQKGQPDIPLKVMSYPQTLTESEFVLYRDILYTNVYKVNSTQDLIEHARNQESRP
ncbi:GNAT family N-acetyltransferase [Paenibacillus sp. SC116]|uniref:GNAT family N-acetyltransferase n=1 Tax=Paenibacillus sp. SC116 TaxID=2968986 RepID=UPI00215AED17|nr:GNAT family N-acetyltransferase [Paenibacillus sp. SC116]MCR8842419.1 GNAT family N-acetyltransferase [Paenibacillus sp. SC116]